LITWCVVMVLDLVKIIYELNKAERERHVRGEGVYWVTDLVRCTLRRDYELKYPELALKELFTPAFVLGDLVHRGLQHLLKERFGNSVSTEVEVQREVSLPSGGKVVVRGRADAVLSTNGERVGIEIKTARADIGLPKEHHVDQVRIYNWLLDLNYSILLYITPDRVAQYMVIDKASEEEVISRVTDTTYPRYPWECSYCLYSVLCPYKRVKT